VTPCDHQGTRFLNHDGSSHVHRCVTSQFSTLSTHQD
jgi:hypothetical protein